MRKRKPVGFTLDSETIRKLEKLSKSTRRPKSTLIDIAVELLFNQEQANPTKPNLQVADAQRSWKG